MNKSNNKKVDTKKNNTGSKVTKTTKTNQPKKLPKEPPKTYIWD